MEQHIHLNYSQILIILTKLIVDGRGAKIDQRPSHIVCAGVSFCATIRVPSLIKYILYRRFPIRNHVFSYCVYSSCLSIWFYSRFHNTRKLKKKKEEQKRINQNVEPADTVHRNKMNNLVEHENKLVTFLTSNNITLVWQPDNIAFRREHGVRTKILSGH